MKKLLMVAITFVATLSALQGCTPDGVIYSKQVFSSVTNFGDSITCGYDATSPATTYGYLFDTFIKLPENLGCRPGDYAADMTRYQVYTRPSPVLNGHQLSTIMIGTNDAGNCAQVSCIPNWNNSVTAAVAWLGIPASDKVYGNAITNKTGNWQQDLSVGTATSDPNATLTFMVNQVVPNHSLFVAYRVFDQGYVTPGVATVNIDGTVAGTVATLVNTGHSIRTYNGTTDTIFVLQVPLGKVGNHSISIKTSSSGGFVSIVWAGASTGAYMTTQNGPRVLLGAPALQNIPYSNTFIVQYASPTAAIVKNFQAEGLDVELAPTATALNPATDISTADNIHPNDQGHAKLAAAFEFVF